MDEKKVAKNISTPAAKREWLKQEKLAYGGLVAASLVLIQPFLYPGAYDSTSAKVAVIAFSIAIPILAALILLNEEESFLRRPSRSKILLITRIIGQDAAFVGIVAAFWHIDMIAGICVIGATIVGMSAHSAGLTKLFYNPRRQK